MSSVKGKGRKGSGKAGGGLEARIRDWEDMQSCGQLEQNIKMMKDGNGQCKLAFRRPGSNK